jgi:hypothetical protein
MSFSRAAWLAFGFALAVRLAINRRQELFKMLMIFGLSAAISLVFFRDKRAQLGKNVPKTLLSIRSIFSYLSNSKKAFLRGHKIFFSLIILFTNKMLNVKL